MYQYISQEQQQISSMHSQSHSIAHKTQQQRIISPSLQPSQYSISNNSAYLQPYQNISYTEINTNQTNVLQGAIQQQILHKQLQNYANYSERQTQNSNSNSIHQKLVSQAYTPKLSITEINNQKSITPNKSNKKQGCKAASAFYPQPKLLQSSIKSNRFELQSPSQKENGDSMNTTNQLSQKENVVVKQLTNKISQLIEEINKLTTTVNSLLTENAKWKNKYHRVKQLYVNKISQSGTEYQKFIFLFIYEQKSQKTEKSNNEISDQKMDKLKEAIKNYQTELTEIKKKCETLESTNKKDQIKLIQTLEIYQQDALSWKEKYELLQMASSKDIEKLKKELAQCKEQKNNQRGSSQQKLTKNGQDTDKKQIEEYQVQLNIFKEKTENLQAALEEKDQLISGGQAAYEQEICQLKKKVQELSQQQLSQRPVTGNSIKQQQKNQELIEKNQQLQKKMEEINESNEIFSKEIEKLQEVNKDKQSQLLMLKQKENLADKIKTTEINLKCEADTKEDDDYLVRQLRKFQELQSKAIPKAQQSNKNLKKGSQINNNLAKKTPNKAQVPQKK